ncbi:hypothetical protein GOODEAATRI_003694 [Goodea atripinnis]|uniref:Uncharacterized protein n=1 Tax=Goodea atripinnis TaxID=208336 RepID=A0ABV0N7L8_9TELE
MDWGVGIIESIAARPPCSFLSRRNHERNDPCWRDILLVSPLSPKTAPSSSRRTDTRGCHLFCACLPSPTFTFWSASAFSDASCELIVMPTGCKIVKQFPAPSGE